MFGLVMLGADSGVKSLQERLIKAGYSCGKAGADGIMGKDTQTAMGNYRAWAETHDLDDDQRKLLVDIKSLSAVPLAPTPSTSSAPVPTPTQQALVKVDVPAQAAPLSNWTTLAVGLGAVIVGAVILIWRRS